MEIFKHVKYSPESISKALNIVASGCLAVSTCFIVISAVMRYFIGKPIHFTEEFCALLFMGMSSLSISYVLTLKKHIRITFLFDRIPGRLKKYVEFGACIVTVIFVAILIKVTFKYAYLTFNLGGVSQDMGIVLFPWMALIPFGLCAFEAVAIKETVQRLRCLLNGRSPHRVKR